MLWFGFSMGIILIICSCLSCCEAVLILSKGSITFLPVRKCSRCWWGPETGQLIQTSQRDIPYYRTLCSIYKLGGTGWEKLITVGKLAGHLLVVMRNCIMHHLCFFFLRFYFYLFFLYSFSLHSLLLPVIVITSVIKLLLSESKRFTFVNSPVYPSIRERSEWMPVWCLASSWA